MWFSISRNNCLAVSHLVAFEFENSNIENFTTFHLSSHFPSSFRMPLAHLHSLIEEGNFPAARDHLDDDAVSYVDCVQMSKELDERGRSPLAVFAGKAQSFSHILASVGADLVYYNPEALTTLNKRGETPLEIARGSEACAEIIGLLSLTPEEARSLGGDEMNRLYAPVGYWYNEMAL